MCSDLADQCLRLSCELEEIRKQNAGLQAKLDQKFTLEEFTTWKLEISVCSGRMKRLQRKFDTFVQEYSMDKTNRALERTEHVFIKQHNESLQKQLSDKTKAFEESALLARTLKNQLDSANEKVKSLQKSDAELCQARSDLERYKEFLKDESSEKEALKKLVEEANARTEKAETELNKVRSIITNIGKEPLNIYTHREKGNDWWTK